LPLAQECPGVAGKPAHAAVVLNAWVTKTTAAEILANPATRRRQATMTISLNPLGFTRSPREPTCSARRRARPTSSHRSFYPHVLGRAAARRQITYHTWTGDGLVKRISEGRAEEARCDKTTNSLSSKNYRLISLQSESHAQMGRAGAEGSTGAALPQPEAGSGRPRRWRTSSGGSRNAQSMVFAEPDSPVYLQGGFDGTQS
jgi:hypothetical protein